ncbi:hypothetical protein As57867_007342, partial [Aphanomyces stellatus]
THLGERFFLPQAREPLVSVVAFSDQFKASELHLRLLGDLSVATVRPLPHSTKRPLTYFESLQVVLARTWMANARNVRFNRVRVIQSLVIGTILGTIFLDIGRNTDPSQERKFAATKLGLYFVSMIYNAFITSSSVEAGVARRAVLYKQTAYHFFPVSTYVLADSLVEALTNIPTTFAFCLPLYFAAGLHASAAAFFSFVAIIYLFAILYSFMFRCFTAITPEVISVKVRVILLVFLHCIFSGYIVPEAAIPKAWLWFYWINPVAWAMRALFQIEYLSSSPLFDSSLGNARFGDAILLAYGFSSNGAYVGGGAVFLADLALVLVTATAFGYSRVRLVAIHIHVSSSMDIASNLKGLRK